MLAKMERSKVNISPIKIRLDHRHFLELRMELSREHLQERELIHVDHFLDSIRKWVINLQMEQGEDYKGREYNWVLAMALYLVELHLNVNVLIRHVVENFQLICE